LGMRGSRWSWASSRAWRGPITSRARAALTARWAGPAARAGGAAAGNRASRRGSITASVVIGSLSLQLSGEEPTDRLPRRPRLPGAVGRVVSRSHEAVSGLVLVERLHLLVGLLQGRAERADAPDRDALVLLAEHPEHPGVERLQGVGVGLDPAVADHARHHAFVL